MHRRGCGVSTVRRRPSSSVYLCSSVIVSIKNAVPGSYSVVLLRQCLLCRRSNDPCMYIGPIGR